MIQKFKFKAPGTVLYAPANWETFFVGQGFQTTFREANNANTLVFLNKKAEFIDFLEHQLVKIEPDSVLWFAYPKGTSKVKTDINRDSIREIGESYGITTVTAISLDETWSALRFRPVDRVGK